MNFEYKNLETNLFSFVQCSHITLFLNLLLLFINDEEIKCENLYKL